MKAATFERRNDGVPLEIDFRGVEENVFLEDLIREKAARLDQLCDNITRCFTAVETRHQHERSGQSFRVRSDMKVPKGHEIVASKDSTKGDIHHPLNAVLKDALDAAGRQVKTIVEK